MKYKKHTLHFELHLGKLPASFACDVSSSLKQMKSQEIRLLLKGDRAATQKTDKQ